jgi:hypothetical protein
MDRVHVVRIDARQTFLAGHGAVAVALATGLRDVERVNGGAGVGLRKDLMRISVTAGAGMLL